VAKAVTGASICGEILIDGGWPVDGLVQGEVVVKELIIGGGVSN
jgi:cytoskeletal protein CcmA (bactofilin family)